MSSSTNSVSDVIKTNSLLRILYTAITKTLDFIQDNFNYDVDDEPERRTPSFLMNNYNTFVYPDLVLSKLSSLSELFQYILNMVI